MSRYLLGHCEREWSRLAEQHVLWGPTLLETLQAHGLEPGARVLEVGCGSGALLEDLHAASGSAVGLERDPAAAARARSLGLSVVEGDLLETDLGGPYDLVVARWVFSFLPEVERAVGRLAAALAPGGHLAVQDYIHDGVALYPRRAEVDRCIEAYRAAYRDSGGDLWVAGRLPQVFAAAGLEVAAVVPESKAGPPGSEVFRWVERFLFEHADGIVASGHLSAGERAAFEAAWAASASTPGALLVSPLQVTVIGVAR